MSALEQRAFRVDGRVQGVGFRWWTQRTAARLGLAGYVRNLPNGAVEVHARGEAGVLAGFAKELERGPSGARVRGVSVASFDDSAPRENFEIRF